MRNEIFTSAVTAATSPATCNGGKLCRIGRSGRTTIGSVVGATGVAATAVSCDTAGAGAGIATRGTGGAEAAGFSIATFGGASGGSWNGILVGTADGGA